MESECSLRYLQDHALLHCITYHNMLVHVLRDLSSQGNPQTKVSRHLKYLFGVNLLTATLQT